MSTAAIPVHVGLVDDTGQITSQLSGIAAALNEQIASDFTPLWKVHATVAAYTPKTLPAGCWAVHVQKKLDQPGALGYHTDSSHQPVAYVELTPDVAVTISHETLEMLADPWGSRLHTAQLPAGLERHFSEFGLSFQSARVRYLLEVCDPCEGRSYPVGGIALSDFLLPGWYRTAPAAATSAYSHAGDCTHPRQVADGGYVSFEGGGGEWYQVFNENGQQQVSQLGKFDSSLFGSLREWTDTCSRVYRTAKR